MKDVTTLLLDLVAIPSVSSMSNQPVIDYGCGYFGTTVRHRNFALDKLAPVPGEEGIGVLFRRGALRPALLRRHPATRGCQSLLQHLRHRDRSECRSQRLSQNISW
jgi:hypothetical protein